MTKDGTAQRIVDFIRESLLPEEGIGIEINETTPLQELGILNSLKTAILMNYMRDELNISIPAEKLSAGNFETVESIVTTFKDTAT